MNDGAEKPWGAFVFAFILVVTALGIVGFWAAWFLSGAWRTATPECYRIFENCFPLPDGVLAALLICTPVALLRRSEWALFTGLPAAGMLLYLAALDAMFGIQHGYGERSTPETAAQITIIVYVAALGLGLACWLWRQTPMLHLSAPAQLERPGFARGGAWLLTAFVALFAGYLLVELAGAARGGCAAAFLGAFALGDGLILLAAAAALAGFATRHHSTPVIGLVHVGMVLFRVLIRGVFWLAYQPGELYPEWLGFTLVWVAYIGFVFALLWRARGWLCQQDQPA